MHKIEADFNRCADTHLFKLDLPVFSGIDVYLKDESTHPTGSLKHRLARSLFHYAICSGWVGEETTVIEASSGSTAVSETYFARLLDLPFIAVMPRDTSAEKIAEIEFYGGCYAETCCGDDRLAAHGLTIATFVAEIDRFLDTGEWRRRRESGWN